MKSSTHNPLQKLLRFCLEEKLIVVLLVTILIIGGVSVAPFDWKTRLFPRNPIPVDAIPNLGENQQIVFAEWMGRSPRDIEDQLTYPLTIALMGVPGVREVRSTSLFGLSSIYLIFEEGVEFYWSRARILERLNSLPADTLPQGVNASLGPDATALGQVFWYTLEGRSPDGKPVGGWDLHELRSIQDWFVRYGLLSAEGISEVASIGGYVKEYHIELNPEALRQYSVTLEEVYRAVSESNLDISAGVTEINKVEYVIRGLGFFKKITDIGEIAVKVQTNNIPILLNQIANVTLGPAPRRGALTVSGAEAVGGVAVVREGYNPLQAINNLKEKITEISPGLPARAYIDWDSVGYDEVKKFADDKGFQAFLGTEINHEQWLSWLRSVPPNMWPSWITISQLEIVPFYDRTKLINETLATLNDALVQQVLITVLVVVIMLLHFGAALVVSLMLPLSILLCFIAMKLFGVDANIVALAGIAIAIGTIVDMGLIVAENVVSQLQDKTKDESTLEVIFRGTSEVSSAILTAILTTVVSFLPVFAMTGAEGKMFTPLAYTKTFVLLSAVVIAITVVPIALHILYIVGPKLGSFGKEFLSKNNIKRAFRPDVINYIVALIVSVILASVWEPLGPERGLIFNFIFVVLLVASVLVTFSIVQHYYAGILKWCLFHRKAFLAIPCVMIFFSLLVWQGYERVFGFIPSSYLSKQFPGLGREFMPPLDEGTFLWMPTTMPHASMGAVLDVLKNQDKLILSVPEVESVVGKLGRADSALDPAPISMIETIINYKSEYITDSSGRRISFRYDRRKGEFVRDETGELIKDNSGRPFRQWREHIKSPEDIWEEIVRAADISGATSAPKLQPIETRLVMLQTGMRASMGIKLRAPDLETLDKVAIEFEQVLRDIPVVSANTVNAERVIGKPYLEIDINRQAIARYGLTIEDVQKSISIALGSIQATTTVEGRERYGVRVLYPRELRNNPDDFARILISDKDGVQIPLREVANVRYERGPQMIRSEDTFLTAYVTFGGVSGTPEVDVVEQIKGHLESLISSGELVIPKGVSYRFAGSYEHQLRAAATLRIVLPLSLIIIFLILYFQFRSISTSLIIFSGVIIAWAGGFVMIWLYGQPWFANFSFLGANMRELFQLHAINLSIAVWVGFLALFGIAVDDGVVMATYLKQSFKGRVLNSVQDIRQATIEAGLRRVRPCLMTTATTILALLPVLTSTGRGADVMIPMAIPTIGGMSFVLITMFTVPVLYSLVEEMKLDKEIKDENKK
jgi:copper/silver efflux system protein